MSEYSKDYTIDELIAVLMAREVKNNDIMIIGVATLSIVEITLTIVQPSLESLQWSSEQLQRLSESCSHH